jgi:hypothetical protein
MIELRDVLHHSLPVADRAVRTAARIESTAWFALNDAAAGEGSPWQDEERDRILLRTVTRKLREETTTGTELQFWLGWLREIAANDGVVLVLAPEKAARHLHGVATDSQ